MNDNFHPTLTNVWGNHNAHVSSVILTVYFFWVNVFILLTFFAVLAFNLCLVFYMEITERHT